MRVREFVREHPRRILLPLVCLTIVVLFSFGIIGYCKLTYQKGRDAYENKEYEDAWKYFSKVITYSDSVEYLKLTAYEQQYIEAIKLFNSEDYEKAAQAFLEIEGYKCSAHYYNQSLYKRAVQLYEAGDEGEAQKIFASLDGYAQSQMYLDKIGIAAAINDTSITYGRALDSIQSRDYEAALKLLEISDGYGEADKLIEECRDRVFYTAMSRQIAAGLSSTISVKSDGSVIYSGTNDYGQGKVSEWKDIKAVDTFSRISAGLTSSGCILAAGKYDGKEIDVSDWDKDGFVSVSVGEQYVIGLTKEGKVIGRGHNNDGQIDVESWKNIVQVDAAWRTTVGLVSDGEINIAGYRKEALLRAIEKDKEKWNDVISIAIGGGGPSNPGRECFIIGLKRDGSVVAASSFERGSNIDNGQCDVYGDEWSDIAAISVGDWHTVGLRKDGTVVATGHDDAGYDDCCKLDEWKDIVGISAGTGYTIGIKKDGTAIGRGYHRQGQIAVEDWRVSVPERKAQ